MPTYKMDHDIYEYIKFIKNIFLIKPYFLISNNTIVLLKIVFSMVDCCYKMYECHSSAR